jgi:flagellar motor component MotA
MNPENLSGRAHALFEGMTAMMARARKAEALAEARQAALVGSLLGICLDLAGAAPVDQDLSADGRTWTQRHANRVRPFLQKRMG